MCGSGLVALFFTEEMKETVNLEAKELKSNLNKWFII